MRPNLNINKIIYENEIYHISNIMKTEIIPEDLSGVIFRNGLYVRCGLAGHMNAFTLGAFLIAISEFEGKEWEENYEAVKVATSDGVFDTNKLPSGKNLSLYYMTTYASGNAKDDNPELYAKVGGATFIGARNNKLETTEIIENWAKRQIEDNGKYIWAIRCILHMITNDEFFDENSKPLWDSMMDSVGFELPSLKNFKFVDYNNIAVMRYAVPVIIAEMHDDKEHIIKIIDEYSTLIEMAGREAIHGSSWDENFYTDANDDLIFKYLDKSSGEISTG